MNQATVVDRLDFPGLIYTSELLRARREKFVAGINELFNGPEQLAALETLTAVDDALAKADRELDRACRALGAFIDEQ